MPQFNLNDYETVKSRKEKFYKEYEDGRIVVRLCNAENPLDYALFEARVYLNKDDQEKDIPRATGYALEVRDKELSINKYGKEYESVNYSSWTENCEESAVGRALDNAGYSGNKKASREEMEKVGRMNTTMKKVNSEPVSTLTTTCKVHDVPMKEYMSKKTGQPYFRHDTEEGICFGKGVVKK